jgi:hypothetical protein
VIIHSRKRLPSKVVIGVFAAAAGAAVVLIGNGGAPGDPPAEAIFASPKLPSVTGQVSGAPGGSSSPAPPARNSQRPAVSALAVEAEAAWREEALARYPKLMETLSQEPAGQKRVDALVAEMPGAKTLRDRQLLGLVADAEYRRHQQALAARFPHLATRFKTEIDPTARMQTLQEEMTYASDPEAQWMLSVAHSDAVMHHYGTAFMDLSTYLRTEVDGAKRIAAIEAMAEKATDAEVATVLKHMLAAERGEEVPNVTGVPQ